MRYLTIIAAVAVLTACSAPTEPTRRSIPTMHPSFATGGSTSPADKGNCAPEKDKHCNPATSPGNSNAPGASGNP
jgi:hypothetical protein